MWPHLNILEPLMSAVSPNVRYVRWDFHPFAGHGHLPGHLELLRMAMAKHASRSLHRSPQFHVIVSQEYDTPTEHRDINGIRCICNTFEPHVWWLDPDPNYKNRKCFAAYLLVTVQSTSKFPSSHRALVSFRQL